MKRFIALAAALLFVLFAFPASAAISDPSEVPEDLYSALEDCILSRSTSVDVSALSVTADQLKYAYNQVVYSNPLAVYVTASYSYNRTEDKQYIRKVFPNYSITDPDTADAAVEYVSEKISAITETLPEGLDDYQKAAYLHDYVCLAYRISDSGNYLRNLLYMLMYGHGVSEAYARLYIALLQDVGLQAYPVIDLSTGEVWVEARLGGNWYHVDVTCDESYPDVPGRSLHERLFQSTTAVRLARDGSGFVPRASADDRSLDLPDWKNIDKPFAFINGQSYLIDGRYIREFSLTEGIGDEVYRISDLWDTPDEVGIDACFSGLGFYRSRLIFNTPRSVCALDPVTGKIVEFYTPEGEDLIYGVYTLGDKLYVITAEDSELNGRQVTEVDLDAISDSVLHEHEYTSYEWYWSADFGSAYVLFRCECGHGIRVDAAVVSETTPATAESDGQTVYTAAAEFENETYNDVQTVVLTYTVYGDANGDHVVDVLDYLVIKRHFLGTYTIQDQYLVNADVNGDGRISAADYLMVKRHVLGTYVIQPPAQN
ncbi:MAG: hypothetical protein J5793_04815 [Clostridia bacterium]|nr:hypothetical protein [Clostridia bacterium]